MSIFRQPADLPTAERSSVAVANPQVTSGAATSEMAHAEQRAWLLIWVAFATFCVLLGSAAKIGFDYVTLAEVNLTARAEDVGGEVYAQAAGGPQVRLSTSERELPAGSRLEAARGGSARIRLFDDSYVTLQSEAVLELARMDVGRFINRRTLALSQVAGPVRYQAEGPLTVEVPGARVQLARGDATVWVLPGNRTRVLMYEGEARVEVDGRQPTTVAAGKRAEIDPATDRRVVVEDRPVALLKNGELSRDGADWLRVDVREGPRDVDGDRAFVDGPLVQGRQVPSLRVARQSVALQHAETGLRQPLDVDVSGFRSLYVEALVRVDYASLSGGGQLGSEYPMMLRVQYEGSQPASKPDWVVGFYYENPENRSVRLATLVPRGEWVSYRVNLMDQPDDRRPYRLLSFEVLGQGHSYDAQVAAIRLVGD